MKIVFKKIPAWCPSDVVVIVWLFCCAAIARFIKISLHSSAVRCIGPDGVIKCVPLFLLPVVVKTVWVFVSIIPFVIEWFDWSDWTIKIL